MNIGNKLYGFTLKEIRAANDISSQLNLFEHDRSGARLLYIDRRDTNMTFAIGFKTIPDDSTGVFHIIEHSVLCGSDKFPLKEPFVDLLKGSLKTFLNAITYPDKTIYPVASRDKKDFHNLVDVYMDAVLHPLAIKDERIFMQEGHRYELDNNDDLKINGVVYNEMKGAYASVDDVSGELMNSLVYNGSTYAKDSGGNPSEIKNLTFEQFKNMHEKFYSPSNSYIFLDGDVDLNDILPLLDSYLCEYGRTPDVDDITMTGEVITEPLIYEYEAAEDSVENGERVVLAYRIGEYSEVERNSAISILANALTGTNSSPLKQKMLNTGLCENLEMYVSCECKYSTLTVELCNIKNGKRDTAVSVFKSMLSDMLNDGIDPEHIEAAISMNEFRARESDFGSYPKGLVYICNVLESWLYGGEPDMFLHYEWLFTSLREKMNTSYFYDCMREVLATAEATLILVPSAEIGEIRDREERERLARIKESMSPESLDGLREKCRQFDLWQQREDTEEALRTIPTLSVSEIGTPPTPVETTVIDRENVRFLCHPISTNGITYLEFYFDASDIPTEDISKLNMLCTAFCDSDTEKGDSSYMLNRINIHTGGIYVTLSPVKNGDKTKTYILVKISCLDSKLDTALELLKEYIYTASLDNEDMLLKRLYQAKKYYEDAICSSGSSFCVNRACASYDALSALKEKYLGFDALFDIKKTISEFDNVRNDLTLFFKACRDRIFVKQRVTVGITSMNYKESIDKILNILAEGEGVKESVDIPLLPKENTLVAIPQDTGFSGMSGIDRELYKNIGAGEYQLLSSIISYVTLWDEIRVKGGAYGAGYSVRLNSGCICQYSYRDPTPTKSISVFKKSGELLREFLRENPSIDNFIIGALGEQNPLSSPRRDGNLATVRYLSGMSDNQLSEVYNSILTSNAESLITLSHKIDEILNDCVYCVVAREDSIKDKDEYFNKIIRL